MIFFLIRKITSWANFIVHFDMERKQIFFQIPFQIMKIFTEDNIWFPHVSDFYQDEAFSMMSFHITQD